MLVTLKVLILIFILNNSLINCDYTDNLIFTKFIEKNETNSARKLSTVKLKGFEDILSYSGYFTVDKKHKSNLFCWFFPSENNYKDDPVLLWLQGGPGSSSLIGLFFELGPLQFTSHGALALRKHTWTKNHSLIFIDNPVGTGLSYTDKTGYLKTETQIAKQLWKALSQFFKIFPELRKNDFFLTGESYAGKYIPVLGMKIHEKNKKSKFKINLKGLSIGNGFCDPINQISFADYLNELGLMDSNDKKIGKQYEKKIIDLIKKEEYTKAYDIHNEYIGNFNRSFIYNSSDFVNLYNYLHYKHVDLDRFYYDIYIFMLKKETLTSLHVDKKFVFNKNRNQVADILKNDFLQSVSKEISKLLEHYPILFYNGQLDIIVAYPFTINFLEKLKFNSAEEYKKAKRKKWFVENMLAGYVKKAGNLTEVLIRDAGHLVPKDQPKWSYDLIYKFIRNISLY